MDEVEASRFAAHPATSNAYHSDMALLPDDGVGLVVLTGRNSALHDAADGCAGTLRILAGGPAPEVSRSFVHASLRLAVRGEALLALSGNRT